jgi:hypothetical protein
MTVTALIRTERLILDLCFFAADIQIIQKLSGENEIPVNLSVGYLVRLVNFLRQELRRVLSKANPQSTVQADDKLYS